jgi:hypothetical protein
VGFTWLVHDLICADPSNFTCAMRSQKLEGYLNNELSSFSFEHDYFLGILRNTNT